MKVRSEMKILMWIPHFEWNVFTGLTHAASIVFASVGWGGVFLDRFEFPNSNVDKRCIHFENHVAFWRLVNQPEALQFGCMCSVCEQFGYVLQGVAHLCRVANFCMEAWVGFPEMQVSHVCQ